MAEPACRAKLAWWTVKRQAMCADACDPVGLYFGTTGGALWVSTNEGSQWQCIARNLPEIYAVETAEVVWGRHDEGAHSHPAAFLHRRSNGRSPG